MSRAVSNRPHDSSRAWKQRALCVAAALLLAAGAGGAGGAAAATKIYRTVDADGNVVFTDVPPRPDQRGDAVEVETPNSFTPAEQPDSRVSLEQWLGREEEAPGEEGEEATVPTYQSLRVTSPTNDQSIRDNAGNLTVTAAVEPELAAGHVLQVYIDGNLSQSGPSTSIQLSNLDRGTHSVQVRVVDQTGATLISSEPSTFHLHRRSVILQPSRPANASN